MENQANTQTVTLLRLDREDRKKTKLRKFGQMSDRRRARIVTAYRGQRYRAA